jgi:alkaline phosphatase D
VNEPTPVAAGPVAVEWVLATDPTMTNILRQGVAMAQPEYGFSVHVDVQGLAPDCHYWYNFRVGGSASPIGRTRTLPAAETASSRFRFNVVSCQHWENGYFDAYDGMKDDDAAFVLHLGDYIYEVGRGGVRNHEARKAPATLAEFRARQKAQGWEQDQSGEWKKVR